MKLTLPLITISTILFLAGCVRNESNLCKEFDKDLHGAMMKITGRGDNEWSKYDEEFVYSLCNGDIKGANEVIWEGSVSKYDALEFSKKLRIKFTPEDRDIKSYAYEDANKKLSEFVCSACASNLAQEYVDHPDSMVGKVVRKALDGDKASQDLLVDYDATKPLR